MRYIIDIPTETYKNTRFYGLHLNPRDAEVLEKALAQAEVCKTGNWVYEGKRGRFPVCRCSVCGNEENADWAILGNNVNYCPNCGSRMVNEVIQNVDL